MSRLIFPEWTESLKKWVARMVLGAPLYLGLLIYLGVSPEALTIGYQPDQPVPYSHALHAGELGMDCRYCHTTVERSAKAAVPPAATCMNLLDGELAPGAMAALNRGDRATHDAAVVAAARRLAARGAALIALAQFSMAHVAHPAGQATGLPVLTTVDSAVAAMRHRLA